MTQWEKRRVLKRIKGLKDSLNSCESNAKGNGPRWDQAQWTAHYRNVREIKGAIANLSRSLNVY